VSLFSRFQGYEEGIVNIAIPIFLKAYDVALRIELVSSGRGMIPKLVSAVVIFCHLHLDRPCGLRRCLPTGSVASLLSPDGLRNTPTILTRLPQGIL
jgi:hypothetical protein